jgi:hypothetical protein
MVLAKKLLFILTYLPEVHSHICPLVRGKPFYRKSLKTPLTRASVMSFPKKKKNESSPEPKEEEYATESIFFQILPIIWLPLLDKKRKF